MAIAGPFSVAPAGSTGNNVHNPVYLGDSGKGFVLVTVVEAAGATPTADISLLGSEDGVNFNTLSTFASNNTNSTTPVTVITVTTVGTRHQFSVPGQFYKYVKLNVANNTNITYHADVYVQQ